MLETIGVVAIVGLAGLTAALLLWRQLTGRGGGCDACRRPDCNLRGDGRPKEKK